MGFFTGRATFLRFRVDGPQQHGPGHATRNRIHGPDLHQKPEVFGGQVSTFLQVPDVPERPSRRVAEPPSRLTGQSLDELQPDPNLLVLPRGAELAGVHIGRPDRESHAHRLRHVGEGVIESAAVGEHRRHEPPPLRHHAWRQ